MANLTEIARKIVDSVGTDTDSLADAIAFEVSLEATRLSEELAKRVDKILESLTEPVSWKQAFVLEKHGIARKTAKTYTVGAFESAMALFDHSDCEVDHYDETELKLKKGCPFKMELVRAAREAAEAKA